MERQLHLLCYVGSLRNVPSTEERPEMQPQDQVLSPTDGKGRACQNVLLLGHDTSPLPAPGTRPLQGARSKPFGTADKQGQVPRGWRATGKLTKTRLSIPQWTSLPDCGGCLDGLVFCDQVCANSARSSVRSTN
jgi:hypothetical protein